MCVTEREVVTLTYQQKFHLFDIVPSHRLTITPPNKTPYSLPRKDFEKRLHDLLLREAVLLVLRLHYALNDRVRMVLDVLIFAHKFPPSAANRRHLHVYENFCFICCHRSGGQAIRNIPAPFVRIKYRRNLPYKPRFSCKYAVKDFADMKQNRAIFAGIIGQYVFPGDQKRRIVLGLRLHPLRECLPPPKHPSAKAKRAWTPSFCEQTRMPSC